MVAGATGLVGREVLAALLADSGTGQVHVVVRRPTGVRHVKLTEHRAVDFTALPVLPRLDEAYIALGTTIKLAGSQAAFRAVDFDAVMAVARAAYTCGATRLGVVSAMGADAGSRVFYNRTKGEVEHALATIGYRHLVIARPSLLAGDRTSVGQPRRPGEHIGLQLSRLLRGLIPANYQPIAACRVATCLVAAVRDGPPGQHVLLSGAMQ